MQIRGSIAVVTGASSGIGEATAWALAARGATVVLAARRLERLEVLAKAIHDLGGTALAVRCDVSSLDQIEALATEVDASFGRCDILINNAGIPGGGRLEDLSQEQIDKVVRVNVLGVMHTTRAFLPSMVAAGSGHIVNISSIAGRHATPTASVYAASKHAVASFSEALAGEVLDQGIRVTSINPAFTTTEGFPQWGLPSALVMEPDQVARAIVRAVARDAGTQISVPRWAGILEIFRAVGPVYRMAMRRIVSARTRPTPARSHDDD